MAKTLLYNYVFTPGAPNVGTISVLGNYDIKRLLVITNVTRNIILYNFADPSKGATYNYSSATGRTTYTLATNTATMSSSDKLQIYVDSDVQAITPSLTLTDPTDKFRVTQPQALIDTDFEYGTQITKWENLGLINNRPFAFSTGTPISGVNYILNPTGSRTVTVGLQGATPGTVGTPVSVLDSFLNIANGNFVIESISGAGNTIFTYTGRAQNTTTITQLLDGNKTGIYTGALYTNAQIGGTPTITSSDRKVSVTTTVPHGLGIGNEIAVIGTSAAGSNPPNGSFVVTRIASSTSFEFYANVAPAGAISGGGIYVRPQAQFLHRPFDGGVLFSSNANANYETAIRQTRRYFRYQSGKGIQVSSGTIIKPNLQIDSMVGIGTTVTVTTREQHNLQGSGSVVTIFGANQPEYNGTFPITGITGYNTFQYNTNVSVATTQATGLFNASISEWYGCVNRLGIFDSQNGLFFEFDGQTMSVVRRSSTFQISGKATVTNGSSTVTQTNPSFRTFFASQLDVGDFIVIRGQSYRVTDIASETQFEISPAYRGTTAEYAIISKTQDLKIPQSQWNLDKMDGTGPSGYTLDLTKMQMFYIDYSWYGAGYVRWGFRAADGTVTYCHKLQNNNVNTEAYMRSGNLPARYETTSFPPITKLRRALGQFDTTVGVASTAGFPRIGTLVIRDANTYEFVNYTGLTTDGFTGVIRAQPGTASVDFSIAANSNVGIGTTADLQIGMRVVSTSFPESTFITGIGRSTITFSQAATSANPTGVIVPPLGINTGASFQYSLTNPVAVELAYPSFGPSISHWGTSVIMDGRFDDDKSLIFTYGQATSTSVPASSSRALFSIRVAPSVDNGQIGAFGARELINRLQLKLNALDLTTQTANANLLVRAYLNAAPNAATNWTNAVGNVSGAINSSLAQIADYAGGAVIVNGGEVTAGFFVGTGANSIDLSNVRDLGNSILGGGGATANAQIYPDGPDTLTIVVTNLSTTTAAVVFGRLSWTEAQA
jgi:hypothetical protein